MNPWRGGRTSIVLASSFATLSGMLYKRLGQRWPHRWQSLSLWMMLAGSSSGLLTRATGSCCTGATVPRSRGERPWGPPSESPLMSQPPARGLPDATRGTRGTFPFPHPWRMTSPHRSCPEKMPPWEHLLFPVSRPCICAVRDAIAPLLRTAVKRVRFAQDAQQEATVPAETRPMCCRGRVWVVRSVGRPAACKEIPTK